jgi:hypothetical protein
MLLGRSAPRAGLVALRQTFVRCRHLETDIAAPRAFDASTFDAYVTRSSPKGLGTSRKLKPVSATRHVAGCCMQPLCVFDYPCRGVSIERCRFPPASARTEGHATPIELTVSRRWSDPCCINPRIGVGVLRPKLRPLLTMKMLHRYRRSRTLERPLLAYFWMWVTRSPARPWRSIEYSQARSSSTVSA